ncbi:MAG TPA: hypothetical protein VKM55_05880 [Candidatus Lokiarchaeia archaeon]|nr:hypothetical protein [Candidatus Lokiarchaeia archaeon]
MPEKAKKSGKIEAASETEPSADEGEATVAEEDTSDIGVFVCK